MSVKRSSELFPDFVKRILKYVVNDYKRSLEIARPVLKRSPPLSAYKDRIKHFRGHCSWFVRT